MGKFIDLVRESLRNEERSYTSGSLRRAIVLLSIPMVLEMIMESLFAVVDVFFVAKVGINAVATVGLTETVITVVYSLAIGISMAATAMVARRVGEKKPEAAARAGAQAMLMALILSVLISVFGMIYAADILRLMGGDEELVASGVGYMRIMMGTNSVIMFLFLLNGIFRGAGDASLAMRSLWLANGVNILLDPLFIFGWGPFPEMGVAGAAVATSIGRGLGVAYQLKHLLTGSGVIRLKLADFVPDWQLLKKLGNIAATGAGQFLISSASWIFLMRIIAKFGSEAVAGYTIAIRLIVFTILPAWGLSNAASTLVGQNLGAGKPERAEASVWTTAFYNMMFLLLVSIVFSLLARPLILLFNGDPQVVKAGVTSLRIICLGYIFFAYAMVLGQAFNGAGDTRTPTLLNFICFWLLEIPVAYLFAVQWEWGLAGVCWAIAGSETLLAVLLILIFRQGKWKSIQI